MREEVPDIEYEDGPVWDNGNSEVLGKVCCIEGQVQVFRQNVCAKQGRTRTTTNEHYA